MRIKFEKTVLFGPMLAAVVLVLLAVNSADAQCSAGQTYKLLPDDGAAGDWFGGSVSIAGTTAIVGAWGDDDNGEGSGSAYLFDTTTGNQIQKLLPDDGAALDNVGLSVGISDVTAIIGHYNNTSDSGSAYLFDTTTGQQTHKLLPDDGAASDGFGRSVAISGTTAIVADSGDDDNGENSGSAYLFGITTGQQNHKLLADDGAARDNFGYSVAISGTTAIVGAFRDDDYGENSGSAYLFDTTTGQQIHKLLPDDGAAEDRFGYSVAISGSTAIVGARWDDDNGDNSGSAYLFDTTTGQQTHKLLPDDGGVGVGSENFGRSVAISGNIAIVGASWDDNVNGELAGSAYLFDTVTGQQIAKLLPDDGDAEDWFGFSVAISGTSAIIGAPKNDDNGDSSGSAYVFDTSCLEVVTADSFLVTRGTYVSGGVVELAESDNADLSIQRSTADIQSRTELEVKAVSPIARPSSLEVTLEGSVFARSQVNQTIELYDYVAGAWEQVDTREATRFSDSTVTVAATGDLSRFVEPGTNCIEARIRYESTNPRQRFSSNTDQFMWTIGN